MSSRFASLPISISSCRHSSYRLTTSLSWAKENGIAFKDREELCANVVVHQMVKERIDTLQQSLAHYEQIKHFVLLPHHFSLERGELTNTLKIKRNIVVEHYKEQIDTLYEKKE